VKKLTAKNAKEICSKSLTTIQHKIKSANLRTHKNKKSLQENPVGFIFILKSD
jgi:hypothetical protein